MNKVTIHTLEGVWYTVAMEGDYIVIHATTDLADLWPGGGGDEIHPLAKHPDLLAAVAPMVEPLPAFIAPKSLGDYWVTRFDGWGARFEDGGQHSEWVVGRSQTEAVEILERIFFDWPKGFRENLRITG